MRAECLAGFQDVARDSGAGAQAAPFGDIRLNHRKHIVAEHLRKAGMACDILAGGERNARLPAQALPLLPRAVGANGFFQPGEVEFGKQRSKLKRALDRPALIDVCRQHAVADQRAQRGEIGAIACRIEADLQFQRAVAPRHCRLCHVARSRRIDAAGIHLDRPTVTAEQLPQRRIGAPRMQIPDRKIDARDRLRERTGFAGLQRQHRSALRQCRKNLRGIADAAPDNRRRQDFIDQSRPMLRPHRREVRPHLAPPGMAIAVLGANEYRRPIEHPAKGCDHGR
jgi:hypothetical protein